MVSLCGRGFESHQLHPRKTKEDEKSCSSLNYRTFAFVMGRIKMNISEISLLENMLDFGFLQFQVQEVSANFIGIQYITLVQLP